MTEDNGNDSGNPGNEAKRRALALVRDLYAYAHDKCLLEARSILDKAEDLISQWPGQSPTDNATASPAGSATSTLDQIQTSRGSASKEKSQSGTVDDGELEAMLASDVIEVDAEAYVEWITDRSKWNGQLATAGAFTAGLEAKLAETQAELPRAADRIAYLEKQLAKGKKP